MKLTFSRRTAGYKGIVKEEEQMRRDLLPRRPVLGLFLALAVLSADTPVSSRMPAWMDCPELCLRPSVRLERHMGPNPFSHTDDDYLVITSYEEKLHEIGGSNKDGSLLNVYLLNGFLVHPEHPEGIVHDPQLIVSKWVYESKSATKTAHRWGFTFSESDGQLDRVIYQVIVEDPSATTLGFTEIALREEEVRELQPYFNRAVDKLAKKALGEQQRALTRKDGAGT